MKKTWSFLRVAVLAISMMFVLTACGKSTEHAIQETDGNAHTGDDSYVSASETTDEFAEDTPLLDWNGVQVFLEKAVVSEHYGIALYFRFENASGSDYTLYSSHLLINGYDMSGSSVRCDVYANATAESGCTIDSETLYSMGVTDPVEDITIVFCAQDLDDGTLLFTSDALRILGDGTYILPRTQGN